ncbi:sugar transferase [Paenarthrobacter nitroguajacolicus]|uniref:Sugar transferase n=2 Tax=Paenarthrobacter nitroguajacolicus TaxID=211146 RepID=A0A558H030_PAENT|nr:sugar transferase [Paenarthrobacter nitroguajacolicus]
MQMRILDLLCVVLAVGGAHILRFGAEDASIAETEVSYAAVSVLLVVVWLTVLEFSGTKDAKVLGTGTEEYKRVAASSLWLFGALAVVSYVLQLQTARGYVSVALPLGILLLLASRWFQRQILHKGRLDGLYLHRVLLIGAAQSVDHLWTRLNQHIVSGYQPVAAFLTDSGSIDKRLPVLGTSPSVEEVLDAIEQRKADTVAISSGADPTFLRHLGWALSARDVGMIMAPALTDVSGPRIHIQPVAGLPLVHVTTPKLEGMQAIAKRTFDILASSVLLALLSLPMAVVALLIKLDSRGRVLFLQERIGKAGEAFHMYKFRSMRSDAELRLEALKQLSEGNDVLFKMKNDPRVTRIGKWIRRYSIDELPQLFNVLKGDMSLVGPRPPLPSEVAVYEQHEHRRLMVKPGITGLWQVSGRSDLSWEESIRLDLYYVENWSPAQDLMILFRTLRAVLARDGAY